MSFVLLPRTVKQSSGLEKSTATCFSCFSSFVKPVHGSLRDSIKPNWYSGVKNLNIIAINVL